MSTNTIPPRVREIIGKHLEGLRLHLLAGPDCEGWHFQVDAERRKDAMRQEIATLEQFLKQEGAAAIARATEGGAK